jgi:hypothetical protein
MATGLEGLDIRAGLVPLPAKMGLRAGDGQQLDRQTAEGYYDRAGGDPDAARAMAAKDGWQF